MTNRDEVYLAIDSERDYQEQKWGEMDTENPLAVGEFVLLLEEYAAEARAVWSREEKPCNETMEVIRKVAGIAVNAMEHHGAPWRQAPPRPHVEAVRATDRATCTRCGGTGLVHGPGFYEGGGTAVPCGCRA